MAGQSRGWTGANLGLTVASMGPEAKHLIVIAIVVAILAHAFVRRFVVACLITALIASASYAAEAFIRHEIPLTMQAAGFCLYLLWGGLGTALGIAVVTGIPFYLCRRRAKHRAERNRAT